MSMKRLVYLCLKEALIICEFKVIKHLSRTLLSVDNFS